MNILRNALGSGIRWFTGLTDHSQEQEILSQLEKLDGTQESFSKIIGKQISVVKSVYKTINETSIESTHERQQLLNQIIEETQNVNKIEDTMYEVQVQHRISNLIELMVLGLEIVNREQELLLNIITSTQSNIYFILWC